MVLVHDNDLAEVHGAYDGTVSRSLYCRPVTLTSFSSSQPIEHLQPDAMLSRLKSKLRSAELKIHEISFGLGRHPLSMLLRFLS